MTQSLGPWEGRISADTISSPSNISTDNLNVKRRLTIPADWRKLIGKPERIFVSKSSLHKCLRCLPAREAARRLATARAKSIGDPIAEANLATIAENSELVAWDGQGRIRICDELLDFAGLKAKGEVVIVGKITGFELWSPERWKQNQTSATLPKLGDAIQSVGL